MYSLRRPAILRDSRFGRLEVASGKVVCTRGGESALGGISRVIVAAPSPAVVLVASSSTLLVPDPSPGDRSCRVSSWWVLRAGDATGVDGLAASGPLVGSSTAALGGEGAAALVVAVVSAALGGELVPSSRTAVALQALPS